MPREQENGPGQPRPEQKPKRKKIGDRTPNPLPDKDISTPQPPGDDSPANP